MTRAPDQVVFTLDDIKQCAEEMLLAKPDAIVAQRLLREVLRLPSNDPDLIRMKDASTYSVWLHQLEATQLPNGSWGRFHSQDTKTKTPFRTTEDAIERALALGLDPSEGVLKRARQYILEALQARVHITDPPEQNERWPMLVQLVLAGRLAQLNPGNPILKPIWNYWAEVTRQAFSSGTYSLEREAAAIYRLSGIHAPQGFLQSQHALWILSTQSLPSQLEHALINWIWNKPDGIRYLRVALPTPQPRLIGYWLRSMNLISRFNAWREICVNTLNHIWKQRDEHGQWDYGSSITRSVDFPLSESWHHRNNRRIDYSTCMLVLLRKYFD